VLLAGSPACQQPAFYFTQGPRRKTAGALHRNTRGGFVVNDDNEGGWFWLLWYAVMVAGMIVGMLDLFFWRPG
jgi:hypothetical protein